MGRKRRQGNMTPQKGNSIIEALVESEWDETPLVNLRRMMIIMFNELQEVLKENMQKQFNDYQENTD
jgi:hypothetical protein